MSPRDAQETPDDQEELFVVELVDGELVEVPHGLPAPQPDAAAPPSRGPKALFFVCLLLLVPAMLAGSAADSEPPAVALNSEWVYRAEVGLLIYGLEYLLLLVLWLAYFGKSFGRLSLPSGAGVDVPGGGDLTAAAQQTDTIASEMRASFSKQNEINRALLKRLNDDEAQRDSKAPPR